MRMPRASGRGRAGLAGRGREGRGNERGCGRGLSVGGAVGVAGAWSRAQGRGRGCWWGQGRQCPCGGDTGGPRGPGRGSRWCPRFQGALRDSGGCSQGSEMVTAGAWVGLGSPGEEGGHRGFSWRSLKGSEEDLGGPGEGTGSHQNQETSLRGHRGFPWESQAPSVGTPGVGEELGGGSQDGPQRSGGPGKGDGRPGELTVRAKGPGGVSALLSPVQWLCSPSPNRLFFLGGMPRAGKGVGAELGDLNFGTSLCLEGPGPELVV